MVLYENTYEREGNDAWLTDYVQLCYNQTGLCLIHKKLWNGWGGDIKEDNILNLDESNLEMSQKKLDEYLFENSLEDDISIDLEVLYK